MTCSLLFLLCFQLVRHTYTSATQQLQHSYRPTWPPSSDGRVCVKIPAHETDVHINKLSLDALLGFSVVVCLVWLFSVFGVGFVAVVFVFSLLYLNEGIVFLWQLTFIQYNNWDIMSCYSYTPLIHIHSELFFGFSLCTHLNTHKHLYFMLQEFR